MTRLIPGHDAPAVGSAQVSGLPITSGLATALTVALQGSVEPSYTDRLTAQPSAGHPAAPDNLGGPHPAEHAAPAGARTADTPGAPESRPIGDLGPANGAVPSDITSALWEEYLGSRSVASRDRLVVHYRGLVRGVAARMAGGLPPHVDAADLVQVGMFGLIDAVERFDPVREVRFEGFAAQRIRGAMLDELRAQDWVPRTARARRREVERVRERLELLRHRSVTEQEIAAELGISLRELRGMVQHRQLVSVEALEAGTGGQVSVAELVPDESAPDPLHVAEHEETVRELAVAIGGLGERDREVVRLYYLENRTLAEIGRVLGVTESRVCQLHARLVTRLRSRLTESAAG